MSKIQKIKIICSIILFIIAIALIVTGLIFVSRYDDFSVLANINDSDYWIKFLCVISIISGVIISIVSILVIIEVIYTYYMDKKLERGKNHEYW